MAQSISQEAIGATGLPGATAASRHAGATTSGAPTTGTFAVGDYVVDQTGAMYVCTVAGTPGTWQLSGVSVNENIAGKNFVINGGLDIWQRGTTFTNPGGYTADRWFGSRDSGQNNYSYSQQTSGGIIGLPNYVRIQRTSGDTQTGSIYFNQSIETTNSYPMANQTVTLSFWAKAGANYSATSSAFYARVLYGATNNIQMYHYTSGVSNFTTSFNLTTSWQKFTYTVTIPSTSTQVGVEFQAFPTGTAGANDYVDFAGCQLEIAPQATPFSRAGGSIGGELALCQRYYWQVGNQYYLYFATGVFSSSTRFLALITMPVQMRTSPSFSVLNPTNAYVYSTAAFVASAIAADILSPLQCGIALTVSGATAGYSGIMQQNNTSNVTLYFNAEL